jgi:hypothetical protein
LIAEGKGNNYKVFLLFRANKRDYVYLYLPHNNEFAVSYMTESFYREEESSRVRKLKELERESLRERDKF